MDDQRINIVSGLPRSGTSAMMQMLRAGGLPVLTDNVRAADEDNPLGYLEFECAKQLKTNKSWLGQAVGKVVKIVHVLLCELPDNFSYRVVFMRRDLDEVLASQKKMLTHLGRDGAQLAGDRLKAVFTQQVETALIGLRRQSNIDVLEVNYRDMIENPSREAGIVNSFMGGGLDQTAMANAIHPSLHRNR